MCDTTDIEERVRDLFALLQLVDNKELAAELYGILEENKWMRDGSYVDVGNRPLRIWFLRQAMYRAMEATKNGGATHDVVAFVRDSFSELSGTKHDHEVATSHEFNNWITANQSVIEDFLKREEGMQPPKENDDE